MALTEEKKGQLALIALEEKLLQDGLKLSSGIRRETISGARKLGISDEEACEFMAYLIERVAARTIETLKPQK